MNLLILKGLLIGFISSISFGPVALLIIQKTKSKDYQRGLITGLGASTIETIYAVIAGYGVSIAYNFIEQYQIPIRFIGILIVLILGVKVILSKKTSIQEDKIINNVSTYISDYFSAFLLELFNLQTFFMFIFLFTSFKIIPKETTNIELMKFYFNVFLGTNLWWSLIVFFAVTFRSKLKLQDLQWLNKIIGSLIILFGLVLLTNLLIIKYKTPIHNQ